jgi:hypothetical protein
MTKSLILMLSAARAGADIARISPGKKRKTQRFLDHVTPTTACDSPP